MSRTQVTTTIVITHHAYDRGKERLGFDRNALERMAMKAFVAGKLHKDCKGNLKKYIDHVYLSYRSANNIRIYGEAIYLFGFNTLLTVYNVPNDLKPLLKK
jgi:hypothetical protein